MTRSSRSSRYKYHPKSRVNLPNMAPAANTAKTRKAKGMAADPDSDSDGYQGRLEQAEAARARLRKVCVCVSVNGLSLTISARSCLGMVLTTNTTATTNRTHRRPQKSVTRSEKLSQLPIIAPSPPSRTESGNPPPSTEGCSEAHPPTVMMKLDEAGAHTHTHIHLAASSTLLCYTIQYCTDQMNLMNFAAI